MKKRHICKILTKCFYVLLLLGTKASAINAELRPVDPAILIGSPFTLTCTNVKATEVYFKYRLRGESSDREFNSAFVHIINDREVNLTYNFTESFHKADICCWSTDGSNYCQNVHVGRAPDKPRFLVEEFRWINWSKFRFVWENVDDGLCCPPSYNASYWVKQRKRRPMNETERHRCDKIETLDGRMSCEFDTESDPDFSGEIKFTLFVEATRHFNGVSKYASNQTKISLYDYCQPAKIPEVSIRYESGHVAIVNIRSPKSAQWLTISLNLTCGEWKRIFQGFDVNLSFGQQWKEHRIGRLPPFSSCTLSVSCGCQRLCRVRENCLWSEPHVMNFTVPPGVPLSSPPVCSGCYEVDSTDTMATVYYQGLTTQDQRGISDGYLVHTQETTTPAETKENNRSTHPSNSQKLKASERTVQVSLPVSNLTYLTVTIESITQNAGLNESLSPTPVIIPPRERRDEMKFVRNTTVLYDSKMNSYQISWSVMDLLPQSRYYEYTVIWCIRQTMASNAVKFCEGELNWIKLPMTARNHVIHLPTNSTSSFSEPTFRVGLAPVNIESGLSPGIEWVHCLYLRNFGPEHVKFSVNQHTVSSYSAEFSMSI